MSVVGKRVSLTRTLGYMQFKVRVPESIKGGQHVRVQAAGVPISVRVPKNVRSNEEFTFEIISDGKEARLVVPEYKDDNVALLSLWPNPEELRLALLLGLAIGLSIIFSFIAGVLYSTEPLPAST